MQIQMLVFRPLPQQQDGSKKNVLLYEQILQPKV